MSAASFEIGDYEKSIKFANEALALLEKEADDDPRKLKLLARLTKAKLYLSKPEDSISKESFRNANFQLPRYRPYLNDERGHYPVGHDTASSQYGQALRETTKDAPVVSILFCGIGDARNLYQTMLQYVEQGPKSDQRLRFTILDHKPAMLARDLILFALLDDLARAKASLPKDDRNVRREDWAAIAETQSVVSYLFFTQVIPGYAWDRLQTIIRRLLASFSKREQPISWVYVPVAVQDSVRRVLEAWKLVPTGSYSTERFRELTSVENLHQKLMMAQMSTFVRDLDQVGPFPNLKFEHRVYKDFSIVLPGNYLMKAYDPEMVTIIHDYRNGDRCTKSRLSAYINTKWRSNITLADIEWENENAVPGSEPIPDLSFTPFEVVKSQVQGCLSEPVLEVISQDTLFAVATSYVSIIADAITALRSRMMVEVCLGEMADVLERMRYKAFDRSIEPTSKYGLMSSKWPDKYHVIHMSNIP